MTRITPHLWFDRNAEEAMNYYVSVFKNSKIISIDRYPDEVPEGPMKGFEGKVLQGVFELDGQQLRCLDGGPIFTFNESVSFVVECDGQEEVDFYWEKLSAVPDAEQCGWCKDKFGVSWQVTPKQMADYMGGSDPAGVMRATQAMLQMKKIDIAAMEAAYNGTTGA